MTPRGVWLSVLVFLGLMFLVCGGCSTRPLTIETVEPAAVAPPPPGCCPRPAAEDDMGKPSSPDMLDAHGEPVLLTYGFGTADGSPGNPRYLITQHNFFRARIDPANGLVFWQHFPTPTEKPITQVWGPSPAEIDIVTAGDGMFFTRDEGESWRTYFKNLPAWR